MLVDLSWFAIFVGGNLATMLSLLWWFRWVEDGLPEDFQHAMAALAVLLALIVCVHPTNAPFLYVGLRGQTGELR